MEERANFKFKPKQKEVAARLATMNSALLHADVGTGKTLIMLGVIDILRPRRVLVVAKKGLVAQWINEAAKFGSHLRAQPLSSDSPDGDGFFISYPAAILGTPLAERSFDIVIFDEAHEILGNIDTQQCQRALKITAPRRYALTGTPYSNDIDNLFPILGWLSHPRWCDGQSDALLFPFKLWGLSDYRKRYAMVTSGSWSGVIATINYEELLAPFVVRLSQTDCSRSAPTITVHVHSVELESERRRDYDLFSELREQNLKSLSSVSKMRELVLKPGLNKLTPIWHRIAEARSSILPIVVVSPRHAMTDALRDRDNGEALIDGRTSDPAYQAKRFKEGKAQVLFMGTRCAQGYSFSHCNQMVISALDFSLASFWQTIGRVWRLDSLKDGHVHIYMYKNTIEEAVLNRVLRRNEVARSILGGTAPNIVVQFD